jgi:hypothetical protein
MSMGEHSTNVERLISDYRFERLGGCSNNKGINRHASELFGDCRHIDHTGHVGMAQHALRMGDGVSYLSQISLNVLVFPNLLERVIRVE